MYPKNTTKSGRRGGFTLLELIVAVGVAALMALAMASIFDAVGRTINGGRRLSDLSVYAAMLETAMRRDFDSMSREGFMVIRNEESWIPAGGTAGEWTPNLVKLTREDRTSGRIRRLDEIMFFSKGSYVSQRDPVNVDRVAQSNAARIYYGHGRRKVDIAGVPTTTSTYDDLRRLDPFRAPAFDDPNSGSSGNISTGSWFGQSPAAGYTNPNQFASDWTLLRQVTLLCPASTSANAPQSSTFGQSGNNGVTLSKLSDSPRQVALQPAASSLFLSLAAFQPYSNAGGDKSYDQPLWVEALENAGITGAKTTVFPTFESGLIDVAVTSLSELESQIDPKNWAIRQNAGGLTNYLLPAVFRSRNWTPLEPVRSSVALESSKAKTASNGGPAFIEPALVYEDRTLQGMPMVAATQSWMIDAMPATSTAATYRQIPAVNVGQIQGSVIFQRVPESGRTRVRAEENPPAMFVALKQPQTNADEQLKKAMAIADQQMLMRSGFVPHCSEFVVEWSMGERYRSDHPRSRELVWYGLPRRQPTNGSGKFAPPLSGRPTPDSLKPFVDENGDGTDDLLDLTQVSSKKMYDPNPNEAKNAGVYPASDYYVLRPQFAGESVASYNARVARETARERLMVHGSHTGISGVNASESFIDEQLRAGTLNAFFGYSFPLAESAGGEQEEWPWPRFIRITVSLSDPADASYEQQFQMVFAVPEK
jgi:type II secretory pathway pseudopilin PulG